MREILLSILLLTSNSCRQNLETKNDYPLQVGDIYFDPTIDDPDFMVCDESKVFQYYNFGKGLQYKGEKAKVSEHFEECIKTKLENEESGFLTIRFIVNCEGKTGRYRIQGMDNQYNVKIFNKELTDELLSRTKQLDGWVIGEYEGKAYDYYQYLTFKIENGNLIEIMP